MTYTLITENPLSERSKLPSSANRLDNGDLVLFSENLTASEHEATGWYEVVDTPRPADTVTHTHSRSLSIINGIPTVVWTQREWTALELDARKANTNRAELIDTAKLVQRLARLKEYQTDSEIVAAFARQNNTAPTAAELNRLLKVMLRRQNRQDVTLALLLRLLSPVLLLNIDDTVDTA